MKVCKNSEGTSYMFPDGTFYEIDRLHQTITDIKKLLIDANLNYFLANYALKEVIQQLDDEKDYAPVQSF